MMNYGERSKGMKKAVVALAALSITVALCGCGPSISGSVGTVVDECAELPSNSKATITVTGEIPYLHDVYISDDGSGLVTLGDSSSLYDYPDVTVSCFFDNMSEELANKIENSTGRITIKGEYYPELSDSDSVAIKKCTFVG